MSRVLWRRKVWNGRSKGISTVLGTVFLTLVVLAISTNVFLWTLSQNAQYTQAVKAENQQNVDRLSENVIATHANYSVSELEEEVTIKVTLTNAGSVAAQIINLWVFDTSQQKYTNKSMDLNMNPGDTKELRGFDSLTVTIPGVAGGDEFVSWFVTARGNTVPLQTEETILIAELAQGIGSISMEFPTFRYYEVEGGMLGPEHYNFNVPSRKEIVFGVELINLDESREDINLTQHSCFWLSVPGKNAMVDWDITKVVNQTVVPFDFQILPYSETTLVYFGPESAQPIAGFAAAANILLYGTVGEADYGQNIPFVSIYVTD